MLSRTINLKRADYVVYFTCKFDPHQHFSCQLSFNVLLPHRRATTVSFETNLLFI